MIRPLTPIFFILAATCALMGSSLRADEATGLRLANQLANEKHHAGAALEYRRLAMESSNKADQGALYWMAAHEYMLARRYDQAERMLDRSETAAPEQETEIYLLHSQLDRARKRLREAAFYLERLSNPDQPEELRTIATRRLAALRLEMQDFDGARDALRHMNDAHNEARMQAIDRYETGKDKSPVVGGLLGLIPGLGYAYSGEYANGLRSLILNGLCLWGLIEFIEDDEWGGVAVVGFADVTFYSGSIYGGADAAVRYNRRRLRESVSAIEGDATVRPDRASLPILTLRYEF